MKVTNGDDLFRIAKMHFTADVADHLVRSLNIALDKQQHFPQAHALRAMGGLWPPDTQMSYGLAYAIQLIHDGEMLTDAARGGANKVLHAMVEEAGLQYVRTPGGRVWRKPDPAYLDQPVGESGATMGDLLESEDFLDPSEADRLEREEASQARSAFLAGVYEGAASTLEIPGLPEGLTVVDVMMMVGEHGSRAVAKRLGVDRQTLQDRWKTFSRRVAKALK